MHAAVCATDGKTPREPGYGKALAMALALATGLLFNAPLPAQSAEDPEAEDAAKSVHRIQRPDEAAGNDEREPGLTVPQTAGDSPDTPRLPGDEQQKHLDDLLARLVADPADQAALDELNVLLGDVIDQADAAIDASEPDRAENLLRVIQTVNPDFPGLRAAQVHLQTLTDLQRQLEAARVAMQDGRIDQPEGNSAWFFYRWIADRYPQNEEARRGLSAVQQDMLARALAYAEDLDFDTAERMLENAASVLNEQTAVEHARTAIGEIKTGRAGELESRAIELMDAGDFSASERVLVDLIALGGQTDVVKELRQRMEEVRIYGGFKIGQLIRDHFLSGDSWTPESVIIPAGSYSMGSTGKEKGRVENESPYHRVTFQRGFAMGAREVSVSEFGAFVSATGFRTDAERLGRSTVYDSYSGRLTENDGVYWKMNYEGKPARPGDPVIHVSWNDARAYVNWLADETGKSYRLPSEAEFEYALRAGGNSRYWWGSASPTSVVENITGEQDHSRAGRVWAIAFAAYGDKFWGPAPVASFEPNLFGLFDMGGNVSEWVRDCWHETYVRAPVDGSAWVNPGCDQRVIRGGHWASLPDQSRSAYRRFAASDHHDARVGFRIARDL